MRFVYYSLAATALLSLLCFLPRPTAAFNLDAESAYTVFNGPDKSLFGFAVEVHEENKRNW